MEEKENGLGEIMTTEPRWTANPWWECAELKPIIHIPP